jgi:hypothetical protein
MGWMTHLRSASFHNRVAVVSCLLELGADADKTVPGNYTPLGVAALKGHQEVVELLVEVGNAQLNKQSVNGMTALHGAAVRNQLEPSKYLVARGCSLTVQDNDGRTALDIATLFDRPQLVQFLTSASNLTAANDYSSLRSLCAPYSSPHLSRRISLSLRATFMLCLLHTKALQINDIIAPSPFPSITLTSRIYDHEKALVRHILSYVGTDQESLTSYSSRMVAEAAVNYVRVEDDNRRARRVLLEMNDRMIAQSD